MNERQAVFDIHDSLIEGFNALSRGADGGSQSQIRAIHNVAMANATLLFSKVTIADSWIPREVWVYSLDALLSLWWSVMCEIVGDPIEGISDETHEKFVKSVMYLKNEWRHEL